MEGMVEENGTSSGAGGAEGLAGAPASAPHVVAVTSLVQLTLPAQAPSAQVARTPYSAFNRSMFPTVSENFNIIHGRSSQ